MSSSTTSSPSMYSCAPTTNGSPRTLRRIAQHRHDVLDSPDSYDEEDEEEAEIRRRLSLRGPVLRKFGTDAPWDEPFGDNLTPRTRGDDADSIWSAKPSEWGGASFVDFGRQAKSMLRPPKTPKSTTESTRSFSPASTVASSSRRGLTLLGKNLLPSSSGLSISSSQSFQTSSSEGGQHPITPRLEAEPLRKSYAPSETDTLNVQYALHRLETGRMRLEEPFDALRPSSSFSTQTLSPLHTQHNQSYGKSDSPRGVSGSGALRELSPNTPLPGIQDRPLMDSASPAFALISLEDARERESNRMRSRTEHRPDTTAPTLSKQRSMSSLAGSENSHRTLKGKKSGIMKLFKGQDKGQSQERVSRMYKIGEPTPPLRAPPMPEFKPPLPSIPVRLPAEEARAPNLQLRPVSMAFSRGLPANYLSSPQLAQSPIIEDNEDTLHTDDPVEEDVPAALREQIVNARKGWQLQLFELEAQIRELRDALHEARAAKRLPGSCSSCGCSCGGVQRLRVPSNGSASSDRSTGSVIDRARVKTGGARGVFGSGSLHEWE